MAVKRWNGTSWEVYAGNDSAGRPAVHSSTHDGGQSDELKGRTTFSTVAANYTLALSDEGVFRCIAANSTSATTVTIPPFASVAFPTGSQVNLVQQNTGQVTVAAGAGVTLYSPKGTKTLSRGAVLTLLNIGLNTWVITGTATV